jgi:hypothetical protein
MIWLGTRYKYDIDSNIVDSVKTMVAYGRGDGINIPHTGKLLFSDEFMDGDTIKKDLYIPKDIYGSGLEKSDRLMAYFRLCTVSEEYFLYGKTITEQHNSIDFSMFAEPVSVFSNISSNL